MNSDSRANTPQTIKIKPSLPGFFTAFILFSIPGFISSFLWLIITVVIVFSSLIGLVSDTTDESQTPLTFRTIKSDSGTTEGILVYDLTGAIDTGSSTLTDVSRLSGIYTTLVERDFMRIKKDKRVKALVFRLNTPGGSVFASEVLADLIANLNSSLNQKENIFYFDQIVASGGLWATYKNRNNYVYGSPYGQTGSIGVLLSLPNYKGIADKVGYSETIIKSADSKDIGNPFRDVSTEEKKFLQSQVDEKYNQFIDVVARGRAIEKDRVKEIANGYVFENNKALEYGLINELSSIDSAIERAANGAGISKYNVYEVVTPADAFGGLLGSTVNSTLVNAGFQQQSIKNITGQFALQPGVVYAIDPSRI